MNATAHPAAERYLKELDRALAELPRERRQEIVDEIRVHIGEAAPPHAGEAEVLNVLEELGDPQMIAAEARDRFGIQERRPAGALEGVAIALLLVGGAIIPILGWTVGAVLLWVSKVWTRRDKMIGTLLVPGGLGLAFYFSMFATGVSASCELPSGTLPAGEVQQGMCSGGVVGPGMWWTLLLVLLVIVPIATAIYLGRRAFGRRIPPG